MTVWSLVAPLGLTLVVACLAGCGGPSGTALSGSEADWCRANSSVTVYEAGIALGYSPQEMYLILDDVTVTGWQGPETDARYIRACQQAYGDR